MRQFIIGIALLLVCITNVTGQQRDTIFPKEGMGKERADYLSISTGIGISSFRDFATSPLVYNGFPISFSLAHHRIGKKKEQRVGLSYSFGNYKVNFNNHSASSKVKTVSFNYSRWYKLTDLSREHLVIKVGGVVDVLGNLRINNALVNNAFGIEFIPTLFGSIKAVKDLTRKVSKVKKIGFIQYHLKPRDRNLSFRLNVGLVNSAYRNGYIYTIQSATEKRKPFADYQFRVFSGFRMSSSLNYTLFLQNKNAIQIAYEWDAFKTGGDLDRLEMAFHTVGLTLMFNANNK